MRPHLALLLIAVAGLTLRVIALAGDGGPLAWPGGYDDGVYFSASAMLFDGVLPYRDFIFVHPPGLLWFLGLVSAFTGLVDAAHTFAASRILATLVGAANIFLVGRIVMRASTPFAGLIAAALYAVYPDAISAERSAYLEPVLNLACLSMAYAWLDERRRPVLAGLLLGAACSVKVLGGIWLLAALASTTKDRVRDLPKFVGTAIVSGLALVAPLALPDLRAFIEQTLLFHSWRPPDGVLAPLARLANLAHAGHLATTILGVVALIAMLRRPSRAERFFAVATLLTFAAFLASATYWREYNAHLAASQCALAGLGAAALRRVPKLAVVALIVALQIAPLREVIRGSRARSPEVLAAGEAIREVVPPNECVFAFDPTWTLAGGRLPPSDNRAPIVVDSYGAMLLASLRNGMRYPDAATAFQSAAAQPDVRKRLEACRFAILGGRGRWQLDAQTRAWVDANFLCITPEAGELCVFERMERPFAALTDSNIVFADGWFGEEGTPPQSWRWMGTRSLTFLPGGKARLHLMLHVPLDDTTIDIAIDGKPIDQFTAKAGELTRVYDIDGRELVLNANRTLRPPNDGRALGLRLNRLVWRAAASTSSSP